MKKITILQTRKNITYIVFAISFTFCLLFFGPYEIGIELNNIAAICIALLIQSVIAIRKFKSYTFNIDDKEIKWRFPDMKKEKTIFVSGGIKNVKENWMGFTFNSNNEKHEVRTESIWRKDKKNIQIYEPSSSYIFLRSSTAAVLCHIYILYIYILRCIIRLRF